MVELLKRTFQIFCEKRWLKGITKSIDRYKKAQRKANREYFVMQKLCERYNELYHRNMMGADGKKWNYCPNCGAKMDGDGNENL